MIAWEWQAGRWSGLAGERRRARRHAAARIRSGEADGAVLQAVIVVSGIDGHYLPVTGARTAGRRDGHGIRWTGAA